MMGYGPTLRVRDRVARVDVTWDGARSNHQHQLSFTSESLALAISGTLQTTSCPKQALVVSMPVAYGATEIN
jgi:hypothetical protein